MEHICGNVYMGVILYKIMISELFFKLKKVRKNVILRHFYHFPPPAPQRDFSECLRALLLLLFMVIHVIYKYKNK